MNKIVIIVEKGKVIGVKGLLIDQECEVEYIHREEFYNIGK